MKVLDVIKAKWGVTAPESALEVTPAVQPKNSQTIASHILPREAWEALPAACQDCGAAISREELQEGWGEDLPVPRRTFACGASWTYQQEWSKAEKKRAGPAKALVCEPCKKTTAYHRSELRWRAESLLEQVIRMGHPDDTRADLDELRDAIVKAADAWAASKGLCDADGKWRSRPL